MTNNLFQTFFLTSTSSTNSEEGGSNSDSTERLIEALKKMVSSPAFYIIIGAFVFLILLVYVLRRFVKPSKGVVKVVVRNNQIYKLLDEKSKKLFMVPFKDRLGAVISLEESIIISDKLFINNGPDALYRINYSLYYKVEDASKFYPIRDRFQNDVLVKINDALREYADNGNALNIVKDYRTHLKDILSVIDKVTQEYGVASTSLKINFVEPMGR